MPHDRSCQVLAFQKNSFQYKYFGQLVETKKSPSHKETNPKCSLYHSFMLSVQIIRSPLTQKLRVGLPAFALGDGLRGDLIRLAPTVSHQPTALCKDLRVSLPINAFINYNTISVSCQCEFLINASIDYVSFLFNIARCK